MTYPIELTIDNDIVDEQLEHKNVIKIKNERCDTDEVCYSYALNDLAFAKGELVYSCEQGFYFLDTFFSQTEIENAKIGDIITYHELIEYDGYEKVSARNCLHFGVISETDGTIEGTTIESKWGDDGIYKTKICDVVEMYGNAVLIWKI